MKIADIMKVVCHGGGCQWVWLLDRGLAAFSMTATLINSERSHNSSASRSAPTPRARKRETIEKVPSALSLGAIMSIIELPYSNLIILKLLTGGKEHFMSVYIIHLRAQLQVWLLKN